MPVSPSPAASSPAVPAPCRPGPGLPALWPRAGGGPPGAALLAALAALCFPRACLHCGAPCPPAARVALCGACLGCVPALPVWVPSVGLVRTTLVGGDYGGPLGRLVRVAKTAHQPVVLATLGAHLGALLRGRSPPVDAVVPVPSARLRSLRRGFVPARLIAAPVAAALGVPLLPLLCRHGRGGQRGRGEAARRLAVRREIRCRRWTGPVPRRVLLVDDVVTTGGTAAVCAEELLGLGVEAVHLAAVATTRREDAPGGG